MGYHDENKIWAKTLIMFDKTSFKKNWYNGLLILETRQHFMLVGEIKTEVQDNVQTAAHML